MQSMSNIQVVWQMSVWRDIRIIKKLKKLAFPEGHSVYQHDIY